MMRRRVFLIAVVLQVVILLFMVTSSYALDRFGKVITIQTEAYDTEDVFYGDYVHLSYLAETVRSENWFASDDVKSNKQIYVLFTPDEQGIYHLKAASDREMSAESDDVVIMARYRYQDEEQVHHIDLGLDRYHPHYEQQGEIESSQERMLVSIALSPWGQKKIVEVENVQVEP
ncbi:GDYXXLXY domain-containing protein [Alkalibacillus haloalkaliphilus]|uniref:GDYXXLXY domain-containing protein n=1 Tax=Alkalibacillus haloalkaliphilus TaxID=94136 RepID=UPI0029366247|nr:GDYXXLXY domain-containing protein [Alkalibacillus haloalkaliphilus]MDV2583192.1 GDYXXLXY domain-containing protein [Alkalibacillus haloalkaliphilus]